MLTLAVGRPRALANLIMALASYEGARSPVELSCSPLYHYQYSSITDALSELARNEAQRIQARQSIQAMCLSFLEETSGPDGRIYLQTDTTPLIKAHSPTLGGRGYVAVPNNLIPGNKPLGIGYEVSFVNLSRQSSKWSLPLDIERVGTDETATQRCLHQLKRLFDHPLLKLAGAEKLCINSLDSKYGTAAYLSPSWEMGHMVSVVRLRAGMKVWLPAGLASTGGAPKVYGQKYYLHGASTLKTYNRHPTTGKPWQVEQPSIFERPADDTMCLEAQTAGGREVLVHLWRWNQMMIRSRKGHHMKDKPFSLLAVKVTDAQSGKNLFDKEMFIATGGKRKDEVSTLEAYQTYRHRYDIEPFLRFSKQSLLLDKYQTPDLEHLDNWLLCNQLTTWLLYTVSDEVSFRPRKWRQYLDCAKHAYPLSHTRLSIAQTRQAAQDLFLTFDQNPFIPQKSKKGKPRQKGQTQCQRTRYPVVKKTPLKLRI